LGAELLAAAGADDQPTAAGVEVEVLAGASEVQEELGVHAGAAAEVGVVVGSTDCPHGPQASVGSAEEVVELVATGSTDCAHCPQASVGPGAQPPVSVTVTV
jgi:hypothetical protein